MDVLDIMKKLAKNNSVSDLHLTVKEKPVIRYNGKLKYYDDYPEKLEIEEVKEIAKYLMTQNQWQEFDKKGEIDFSYSLPGHSRFRVNAFKQRGSVSLALRIIPQEVPDIDSLGLPDILKKLSLQRKGLILCTGPTGSGKSTTLAAMIKLINQNRHAHIITLEDPIEYLHKHRQSIVQQREIGSDTRTFKTGLRSALRQDPDVILIGEMRDLETIETALQAAETGHLVLATLHTSDAPGTVERIIDIFPAHQQQQVRTQLATSINGIVSQQLIERKDKDARIAALEVLVATSAVRNIIRDGKTHQLVSTMQTGGKYGMIVMNNYLVDLYNQGLIAYEEAITHAYDPKYVKKKINNSL